MKKIMSFVLSLVMVLLTFNSCGFIDSIYENTTSKIEQSSTEDKVSSSELSKESSNPKSSGTSKKPNTTSKPNKNNSNNTTEETVVTDKEIKEPSGLGKIKELKFSNPHTAVKSSSYYQYSNLKGKEKSVYNAILSAIKNSLCVVNIANISASSDEASSAFRKFLTDYPQYFYISREYWLVYGSNESVRALVLSYSDGEVIDEFDEDINLIKKADRNIINQKVKALESKLEQALSKIPKDKPTIIKEKIIYDYVLQTVNYDNEAAEKVNDLTVTPHAFDLYGAAVNGMAVCEGYAKLFQYLCYNVGINSTQVIGVGEDDEHMWNAVLIENDWYQVDLTWSDTSPVYDYSYFNITTENISKTHTIDSSYISVPKCNSTKNSFTNLFAIEITDLNSPPVNYENTIANIKNSGDKHLYVYVNRDGSVVGNLNFSRNYERYINNNMIYEGSNFNIYLSNLGITLSREVKKIENFYVLTLNY